MKVRRAHCPLLSEGTRARVFLTGKALCVFFGLLLSLPWAALCAIASAVGDAGRALLRCRWITPLLPRKFERARQRRCANSEEGCHD